MKSYKFLILCLLLLVSAPAAFAVNPQGPRVDEPNYCDDDIDQCFYAGDWWYSTTSVDDDGYIFRLVDCGLTEGCKACGTTSRGKPVCVRVQMDASCSCAISPVPNAGPNIVRCDSNGACQYRN